MTTTDTPRRSLGVRLFWTPVVIIALVGIAFAVWAIAPLVEDDHGVVGLVIYTAVGAMVGAGLGVIVGLSALLGNYLAFASVATTPARFVGVSLAAGSSVALAGYVMLVFAGAVEPFGWIIVALAVVLPVVLCVGISRWARAAG
ncbi:ABC-type polysaccharide/polyol phosphate export permease [Conyzicola lurida]|uniref:ABC-type polysaccharide/polyol phosphate export permease n=1 Tax=Conyzicola lurida TaxID=1172621 RepID=A0A841AHG5_9MICO|nr:hypothetical protein [Conyzicola lurida]MBB5841788.1 ABC-type polysaccharide/polyol phosphate export permease [Conyzicola lurida]